MLLSSGIRKGQNRGPTDLTAQERLRYRQEGNASGADDDDAVYSSFSETNSVERERERERENSFYNQKTPRYGVLTWSHTVTVLIKHAHTLALALALALAPPFVSYE